MAVSPAPTSAPRSEDRVPEIELIRFISILAVMACHIFYGMVRYAPPARIDVWWVRLFRNGHFGVSMFFVVSGFVITRTLVRRHSDLSRLDLRGFYVRRAGRILPLLALALCIGALALALQPPPDERTTFCLRSDGARFDWRFWLAIPTFSFNWLRIWRSSADFWGWGLQWDVLWSLAIEEQFYLIYPFLLRRRRTAARAVPVLVGVALLGLVVRLSLGRAYPEDSPESWVRVFTNSFAAFDLIAMGALLCFLVERFPQAPSDRGRRRALAAVGAIGGALVVAVFAWFDDITYAQTVLGIGLCAFLFAGIRLAWLQSLRLTWLTSPGGLSYGGYLLHPMVLFLLWPALARLFVISKIAALAVFAGGTLSLAAVIHRYYEVPINALIRRRYVRAG